jgi:two-component system, LytTR family, response regulator
MPVLNGFEMLKRLTYMPGIIFTTAYEEYAIRAFEENSVDYLLKPVEPERLAKAIEKLRRISGPAPLLSPSGIDALANALKEKKEVKALPVRIGDKILLIRTEQIAYLEAKDKYVYIVTDENIEYLTDFTLSALEEKLEAPFTRVHRAFIINSDKVREFHRGDSGTFIIIMKDRQNTKIYSGRAYSENVKALFNI